MKTGTVITGLILAGAVASAAWWSLGGSGGESDSLTVDGYTQAETRSIASTILATGLGTIAALGLSRPEMPYKTAIMAIDICRAGPG